MSKTAKRTRTRAEVLEDDGPCGIAQASFEFWTVYTGLTTLLEQDSQCAMFFVGHSPSYWWLMLRLLEKRKTASRIRLVPATVSISYRLAPEVMDKASRPFCNDLLKTFGAGAAWAKKFKRIYLVDFVLNGTTMKTVRRLLQKCYGPQVEIRPLSLTTPEESPSIPLRTLEPATRFLHEVMALKKYPRFLPQVPYDDWTDRTELQRIKQGADKLLEAAKKNHKVGRKRKLEGVDGEYTVDPGGALKCLASLRTFREKVWKPLEGLVAENRMEEAEKLLKKHNVDVSQAERGLQDLHAALKGIKPTGPRLRIRSKAPAHGEPDAPAAAAGSSS